MSIRTKAFIVFLVTLTVVVGFVHFFSGNVILKRFESLETMQAISSMERVRELIDQEYERLLSTGVDWASWTDTYEFIQTRDQDYIEGNLNDETVANLGLNLMIYMDAGGELIYGKAYDLERGVPLTLPPALVRSILENQRVIDTNRREENVAGLLVHPGDPPVLFAALPILTSTGDGPTRGSLVLGKYLTPSMLERISHMAKVQLAMETGSTVTRDQDLVQQAQGVSGGPGILVRVASPETVTGTLLVKDFYGEPVLALKGEMPRSIVMMGQSALRQFLLLVIAMTLLVSLAALLVLDKFILSRLYQVISQVSEIRRTKRSSSLVTVSGKDELFLLAQSINGMLAAIHESHHLYESLINTTPIPIIATDIEGQITEWNPAAEKTFGWSRDEILGKPIPMSPADGPDEFDSFSKNLFTGANFVQFETTRFRKDNTPIQLHVYPSRLVNFDGRISGSIIVMTDITDMKTRDLQLRRTLTEKDMLLKEVHHRVKNNLQAISSILDIQKLHLDNQQLEEIFRESQNRIRSMALIHEELYSSRDHILVNTKQYISHLLDHLFYSYDVDREKVELDLDVDELLLNIDTAIPCGLIINELVSNSLKHAFNGRGKGVVHVSFTTVGGVYRLRITDDGVGLPEDIDAKKVDSLGMILVRSLADQLHSSMKVSRKGGTTFEFHFKIYEECQKSQL